MIKNSNQPRIVTGKFKNFKLKVPKNARPLTERVKIILFDTIKDIIDKSTILDLFAGSGNFGIEALSRGAKLSIFVDSDKEAIECLKVNLSSLKLDKSTHKIFQNEYLDFVKTYTGNFDVIFIDPPFKIHSKINIEAISDLLAPEGVLIYKVEGVQKDLVKIPESLTIILEKNIGINTLLFITKSTD